MQSSLLQPRGYRDCPTPAEDGRRQTSERQAEGGLPGRGHSSRPAGGADSAAALQRSVSSVWTFSSRFRLVFVCLGRDSVSTSQHGCGTTAQMVSLRPLFLRWSITSPKPFFLPVVFLPVFGVVFGSPAGADRECGGAASLLG